MLGPTDLINAMSLALLISEADINCYIWKNPHSYCKMKCACCGEEMLLDRESEKMLIYKCTGCGLTDSKLKA